MRKLVIALALCASCFATGCTAVYVREPVRHIQVTPAMPQQDLPPRQPVHSTPGQESPPALYFFRFGW